MRSFNPRPKIAAMNGVIRLLVSAETTAAERDSEARDADTTPMHSPTDTARKTGVPRKNRRRPMRTRHAGLFDSRITQQTPRAPDHHAIT